MAPFRFISASQARTRLESGEAIVVDIRDPQSYAAAHIPAAIRLDDQNLPSFLETADREKPLIVCCYRGHRSQAVARMLAEQGFCEVYSMDGGFEAWRAQHPDSCCPSADAASAD
jgi:thiosulfate sulfurtransferase